jgi:large repetitive protein
VTLPDGGVMFTGLTNGTAYSFTATASDQCGSSSASTGPIFIPKDIQITRTLPNARAGTSYDETITATGGPAYYWSIPSGALPPGLMLNPRTGTISGSPSAAGQWTFTVELQSGITPVNQVTTQTLSLTVEPGFANPSTTAATSGSELSFPVTTTGLPAAKITEKGKLPKGVSFQGGIGTAILTGIPTSTKHRSAVGAYPVTFIAKSGAGKTKQIVTQPFILTVTS